MHDMHDMHDMQRVGELVSVVLLATSLIVDIPEGQRTLTLGFLRVWVEGSSRREDSSTDAHTRTSKHR